MDDEGTTSSSSPISCLSDSVVCFGDQHAYGDAPSTTTERTALNIAATIVLLTVCPRVRTVAALDQERLALVREVRLPNFTKLAPQFTS